MSGRDLTACPRVLRELQEALRRAACTRGRARTDTHWSRLRNAMGIWGHGGGCILLRSRNEMKAGHGRAERGRAGMELDVSIMGWASECTKYK